jgi:hypothetical protein
MPPEWRNFLWRPPCIVRNRLRGDDIAIIGHGFLARLMTKFGVAGTVTQVMSIDQAGYANGLTRAVSQQKEESHANRV